MTTTAPPQTIRPGKSEGPRARYPNPLIRPPTSVPVSSLHACAGAHASRGQGGSAATGISMGPYSRFRIGPTSTRPARTHPILEDGCIQEAGVPSVARNVPWLLPARTKSPCHRDSVRIPQCVKTNHLRQQRLSSWLCQTKPPWHSRVCGGLFRQRHRLLPGPSRGQL